MNIVKKMTALFLRIDKGLSFFLFVGYPYVVLRGFLFFLLGKALESSASSFLFPVKDDRCSEIVEYLLRLYISRSLPRIGVAL
jgi:hypothetical protein